MESLPRPRSAGARRSHRRPRHDRLRRRRGALAAGLRRADPAGDGGARTRAGMSVDFAPTAAKIVDYCLTVQEGERAVVVTDMVGTHAFIDTLVSKLRLRGADACSLSIPPAPGGPDGYLTWEEPT